MPARIVNEDTLKNQADGAKTLTNDQCTQKLSKLPLPQPAASLLPHKPPMLLVDTLLQRNETQSEASAILPTTGIFIHSGRILPEYFIELIAQTAALGNCYDAVADSKKPRDGMLVGIDAFTWPGKPQPGTPVSIKTDICFAFGAIKSIHGQVMAGDCLLATGDIKVWENPGEESQTSAPSPLSPWQPEELKTAAAINLVPPPSLETAISTCCLKLQQTVGQEQHLEASAEFCFPSDFSGFQGHFPGNPVLPAIVQMAVLRFVVEQLLELPVNPIGHKKIKFKGVVRPMDTLDVFIFLTKEGNLCKGNFSLKRVNGEPVAGGTVEYALLCDTSRSAPS